VGSSSADVHHRPRSGHKIRLADVVALFFLVHHSADEISELRVTCPVAHLCNDVVLED
jgi:hypothetical protein